MGFNTDDDDIFDKNNSISILRSYLTIEIIIKTVFYMEN